jgi:hypothetical protein
LQVASLLLVNRGFASIEGQLAIIEEDLKDFFREQSRQEHEINGQSFTAGRHG